MHLPNVGAASIVDVAVLRTLTGAGGDNAIRFVAVFGGRGDGAGVVDEVDVGDDVVASVVAGVVAVVVACDVACLQVSCVRLVVVVLGLMPPFVFRFGLKSLSGGRAYTGAAWALCPATSTGTGTGTTGSRNGYSYTFSGTLAR